MFAKRLVELRKKSGLSQAELARRLKLTRGQLSMYEIGKRTPDMETVQRIADFFGVSVDYMLGREDNTQFNQFMLAANKERILRRIEELLEKSVNDAKDENIIPVKDVRMVPIVATIPCGEPALTEDLVIGYAPVDTSIININSGEYVWLRAVGDSMIDAHILDGSYVLIRLQNTADNGDIVAVCIDNENATLKRIYFGPGVVTLVPENRNMRPMTYEAERVRIVGKAVFIGTKL